MLNHCSENWARAQGPKPWRKPPNAAAVRQSRCNKRDRVRAGVRPPACDQRRSVTPFSPASREALGPRYRSGRTSDWLKFKNPARPAVQRKAEEDWDSAGLVRPAVDHRVEFEVRPPRRNLALRYAEGSAPASVAPTAQQGKPNGNGELRT